MKLNQTETDDDTSMEEQSEDFAITKSTIRAHRPVTATPKTREHQNNEISFKVKVKTKQQTQNWSDYNVPESDKIAKQPIILLIDHEIRTLQDN